MAQGRSPFHRSGLLSCNHPQSLIESACQATNAKRLQAQVDRVAANLVDSLTMQVRLKILHPGLLMGGSF